LHRPEQATLQRDSNESVALQGLVKGRYFLLNVFSKDATLVHQPHHIFAFSLSPTLKCQAHVRGENSFSCLIDFGFQLDTVFVLLNPLFPQK
jgi:hypothetical protein